MVPQGQTFFSLLIFAVFPATILGLKCWQSSLTVNSATAAGADSAEFNDVIKSTLTECNNATTKACTIAAKNETYALRGCSPIKTHDGCVSLLGFKSCFCNTDGCNETFEKAGVEKIVAQTIAMTLIMVLSVLLV